MAPMLKFLYIINCIALPIMLYSEGVFEYQHPIKQTVSDKRYFLVNKTAQVVLPVLSEILPGHGCKLTHDDYMLICQTEDIKLKKLRKFIYWLDQPTEPIVIDVAVYELVFHRDIKQDLGFTQLSQGIRYRLNDSVNADAFPESVIDWIEQYGETTLLAKPSLTVNPNTEAKVQVGDRVPYVQESGSASSIVQSVTFIDTGILLRVNASMVGKQQVHIQLGAEVSSVKFWKGTKMQSVPVISTRKAETALTVPFDKEIVLAGLIDRQDSESIQKVPLLGDLPLLGFLMH